MEKLTIRKASSWEEVSSRAWLARAVLLYDTVLVNPTVEIRSKLDDPMYFAASRDEVIENLEFQEFIESLEGVTEPKVATLMSSITREQAMAVSSGYDAVRREEELAISSGHYAALQATVFQMVLGLEQFHPEIDFYGHIDNTPTKATILPAVETFMPAHPEKLTRNQIIDFRGENELRRSRFMNTANELIEAFGSASNVDELNRVLRLTEQEVSIQYKMLEDQMRTVKIESVVKAMGACVAVPAVATVFASLLAITPIAPLAAISAISLVAAQVLQENRKAETSVRQSAWGYLWEINRL